MKRLLSIAAVLFLALPVMAADDMPLDLYQKLKAAFDDIYGSKSGQLLGTPSRDKSEAENEIKSTAKANKDVLIKALNSSQVIHRELAARSLEYCGDKAAAVEALSKVLTADADESVRRAAATALSKFADASSTDALIKALTDSVETVRALSARALGNIKDSKASEALLKVVDTDSVSMVRMQAALALKKIKDPASLEGLKKSLDSEKDENVKIAIAGAVRELAGNNKEAKVDPIPTAEETGNELAKLAGDMKELEGKLREDRHDQVVQVAGNDIEKKLTALIEKLDKG